jgi:hypothetical protein
MYYQQHQHQGLKYYEQRAETIPPLHVQLQQTPLEVAKRPVRTRNDAVF